MTQRKTRTIALGFAAATAVAAATLAGAATDHVRIRQTPRSTHGATALARTMMANPSQLRGARFVSVPPNHTPVAIGTGPRGDLAGFPRSGNKFALLSTGCTSIARRPNSNSASGCNDRGPSFHGARDVTVLRLHLGVPHGAKCLSFRFRFLSEEFPEFVGSRFNDAFIAQLDAKFLWNSRRNNPTIKAPGDFARTPDGHFISVNGTQSAKVSKKRARGTTYDAATRILRASTPITPGSHYLFLSIFDQGDRQYDSTVFLDRLTLDRRSPCVRGVAPDQH